MIEPKSIIAIDTQALVWGVRHEGPDEMQQQARWLFEYIEQADALVVLPTVVLSEFLTGVKQQDRPRVAQAISERFTVAAFDSKAAYLAAELYQSSENSKPKGVPGGRSVLRADSMIVATAKAFGAEIFISHDTACRKMAKKIGLIDMDLPNIEPNLYFEQLRRKGL